MISDQWRETLYFFGFLSSLAFGSRFLIQWIVSEVNKKSTVPPLFWILSLTGNCILLIHSFFQLQFHVLLVQTCNGVISWRNLNLMQPAHRRFSTRSTLFIFFGALFITTSLFLVQTLLLTDNESIFFRIPVTPWHRHTETSVSLIWHILGFAGLVLFNSRFWFQWWISEKKGTSYLGASFWWLSLIGDALCMIYFIRLWDFVNIVGPLFGFIPYVRNLMLIRKNSFSTLLKNSQ